MRLGVPWGLLGAPRGVDTDKDLGDTKTKRVFARIGEPGGALSASVCAFVVFLWVKRGDVSCTFLK